VTERETEDDGDGTGGCQQALDLEIRDIEAMMAETAGR
jgi:hypothetical protein